MVSRKDFIATAVILAKTNASKKTIQSFSNNFANQNPRFDRSKFLRYIKKLKKEIKELKKLDFV